VRVGEGVRKGDVYEYVGLNEDGIAESRVRWDYTSAGSATGLEEGDLVKVESKKITEELDARTVVDETLDEIEFGEAHGFLGGELVTYHTTLSDAEDTSGLAEDTYYRVVVIDEKTIRLTNVAGTVTV
ncbi:MAG: hypothetical protein GWO04_08055, partial [Actinobacteria bacterium]|nr:hypothetical protein [Actinomycetota bacterium]